jgi:hypothetical protein
MAILVLGQEAGWRRGRRQRVETCRIRAAGDSRQTQLEARYAKVGALLNRSYFTQ